MKILKKDKNRVIESKNVNPAIVVVAFNRANSLMRLLDSLSRADYTNFESVKLIISVDYQNSKNRQAVLNLAQDFNWEYGEKEVIDYKENQGLKKHILSCGDFTKLYGSVILLEDDLLVSKGFYKYASAASKFYSSESKVAGISLYSYEYEELGWFKFYPAKLGGDTFFMQWASSWGQLWTEEHWKGFKNWLSKEKDLEDINIPDRVKGWKKSWKKYYIGYLVDTDKYFVFPYNSYTTVKDGDGVHTQNDSRQNFVQLTSDTLKENYIFSSLSNQDLKYDVFFQPIKKTVYNKVLDKDITVEFDFFNTKKKKNFTADYVFSIKEANRFISGHSSFLIPYEHNLMSHEKGDIFTLAQKENFLEKKKLFNYGKKLYFLRKIYSFKEILLIILYIISNNINKKLKIK